MKIIYKSSIIIKLKINLFLLMSYNMKKFTNNVTLTIWKTAIISASVLIFGIILIHNGNSIQIVSAEDAATKGAKDNPAGAAANLTSTTKTTVTNNASNSITINLWAKEVTDGVYKWINASNSVQNPTIKVFANANNIINIQNPTDTKHQLIIDTGADNLPSSGDILQDGSGHVTFNPNMTGTFTYHCAYHPYTMKGTIEVIKK
jgi:plastocyanin